MDDIHFVDTTIRDGHQSLWAERMSTGMMLPIAKNLDAAGFLAIELLSGSHIKKAVRELREDPWERIKRVCALCPNTPMRLIAGRVNTFGFDPPCMYELFIERMAANGIRQARISEPWNDLPGWTYRVEVARRFGLDPIVNLIYSVSPVHTDAYYAERCRQAVTLNPFRLCLKDPGGLLTPERTRTLVPVVLANAGGIPVELHSHCTTGLGPLVALEAVKLGIRIVNTGVPPLADGSALPSVYNVARNLRALGYRTVIDEDVLHPVTEHFNVIARREGFPLGVPAEYDEATYQHQVPGGMISNLGHQLRQVGKEAQLAQALEETSRVRVEFGYPIMVTPLSQFVGSQAAINVIVGERYKEVTDQVIRYALGHFGEEAVTAMDQEVREKILDRPRAKEIMAQTREHPSIDDMRRQLGGAGVSDEELLLRWLLNKEDIAAMRAAGPAKDYVTTRHPLVKLMADLTQRADCNLIQVSKPGFALTLERRVAGQ
ncbi:MAG: oxaloacetate decarboxylase (Na+ extruding) subunit alpha [Alphaproteobacteria bacterium]|jgi:oxaloacetate decarboxylase alpha subunit|nr:oxaloacetate decarboxylase (Na+ extruding) subunit alpha [Alphaproteobacteria bacterium]MEA2988917.1 oxaloacetate decarboxylase (Na+ extruding) subunit alpha [Alphaproteobacteria bacterium]